MERAVTFVAIYLLGTATPIFIFRGLIAGKTGDESTRILDFLMLAIALLVVLALSVAVNPR